VSKSRVFGFVAISLLLASTVFSEGCRRGPYLWVRSARYKPALPAYMAQSYRGRSLHLMTFTSRTPSRYYFYSPNRAIKYEASPTLAGYLKECFTKGLTTSGVRVLPRAAQNVHSLKVVLLRMSDQQMVFDAFLYLNSRTVFQKRFDVRRGPVRSHNQQHLLRMANYQINLATAKLFMDRGFWAAFFGAAQSPQPATPGVGGGPATALPPSKSPSHTPGPGPGPGPGTPPAQTPPPAPGPSGTPGAF
jgi:hypothetical protein